MARTDNKLLALLGFSCTGDVGPWTIYTSMRRQIVFYPRMPALNPPSPRQQTQRAKWTDAAADWHALTPSAREQYELASRRGSLKATGYNLWMHLATTNDDATRATIARQTNTTLQTP